MIVYKYTSLGGLKACLKNRTLRFSKPTHFNDPFDCAAATGPRDSEFKIRTAGSTNADKLFMIQNAFGILSLTRNPLNLLMWAHYSENHKGGVVAIDTEEAGLECDISNIIPANCGKVIYSNVRPSIENDSVPLHSDLTGLYDRKSLEKLFLYKSLHWAYEEEVRVIRRIDYDPQKKFEDIEIPMNAIKKVYLGARYFKALIDDQDYNLPIIHEEYPEYEFHLCYQDEATWDIHSERYVR